MMREDWRRNSFSPTGSASRGPWCERRFHICAPWASSYPARAPAAVREETIITLTGVHAAKQGAQIQRHALRKISGEDLNGSKQMSFRPRDPPRGPSCDCGSRPISIERPLPASQPTAARAPVVRVVAGKPDRATKRSGGTGKRGSDLAPCWQGHVRREATPVRSVVRRGTGSRHNIERASRSTHSHRTSSGALSRLEVGTIRPCAHEAIRGPRSDSRKL